MPVIKSSIDASQTAPEFGAAVRRRCQGLWIPRHSVLRSAVNLAPGKPSPDAVIVGAPTMSEGNSCLLFKSGTSYFQMGLPDFFEQTIYACIKTEATLVDVDNRPAFFGTGFAAPVLEDTAAPTFGTQYRITVSGSERWGASFGNTVADDLIVSDLVAATHNSWHWVVCKVIREGVDRGIYIDNVTDIVNPAKTLTTLLPRFPSQGLMQWGSFPLCSERGTNKGCWLQVHDALMTPSEDALQYEQAQEYHFNNFGRTF